MATRPVRTSSLTPYGRSISTMASILSSVPVTSTTSAVDADVDDLGAEDVDDLDDGAAVLLRGGDLDQRQLARDDVVGRDVADLHDLDDLEELLRHLLDVVRGAVDGEGHAREARDLAVADREALDVEGRAGATWWRSCSGRRACPRRARRSCAVVGSESSDTLRLGGLAGRPSADRWSARGDARRHHRVGVLDVFDLEVDAARRPDGRALPRSRHRPASSR